jgi:hypothetical protein
MWMVIGPNINRYSPILAVTPDGTIYIMVAEATVYRLSPGASRWQSVLSYGGTPRTPVAVSWDANGHPFALWSDLIDIPAVTAALQYRAP